MRDSICTIPVSEVFEKQDGCPLCRMYNTVENRILDYILGDAMMEPDVRIMTNEIGFCPEHYEKMTKRPGTLQLALMLQTHTQEINEKILHTKKSDSKKSELSREIANSCFVCEKIEWGFSRMIDTIYRCYENEEEFRKLFNAQPQFCLSHYERLLGGISKKTCRKHGKEMAENLNRIVGDYSADLYDKISVFCTKYDYRNAGKNDFSDCENAVGNVIDFLTGKRKEK